jgi:hypothetical protein
MPPGGRRLLRWLPRRRLPLLRACADVAADYAGEVMARAVRYGFLYERCGELPTARACRG